MNRRYFLPTLAAATASSLASAASDRVNVAIIGVRGRGRALAGGFAKLNDVSIEHLVDVDERVIGATADVVEKAGKKRPKAERWMIARSTEGYSPVRVPRLVLAKGNYFGFTGKPVFTRLIYPAPVEGGLGTHVTLDLAGRMRFGPYVEWIEQETYTVDPKRSESFYASVRTYWPVTMVERAGMQTTFWLCARRKFTPPAARRSTTGVRATVPPLQPSASKRCWSVVMKRTLRPMCGP